MNKKVFILLNLFVLTILANEFSLKIEIVPKKTILGTPIYLEWVMKNESKAEIKTGIIPKYDFLIVITDENGKELKRVGTGEILYREGRDIKVIKRGEEIRGSYNLSENYRLVAGVYKVYLRWRSNGIVLNAKTKQYETVWAGDIRSNEEEFIIEEPNGIDKEVYNKYHYEPEGKIMCCNKPNEVLEKYPTSTYAGWVLYNFDIDWYTRGTCSICDEKIIKDINEIGFFKALENLRNSKKEIERKEKREKTIEFLEKFIKEHPEFPFIGYYYATLADKYLIKGDIKKACENYKKSLELEWNLPRISKKETEIQKGYAEKAYGYLEKNGVCK